MKAKKKLAIVGVGRWGKNLLKGFSKIADVSFCFHQGNAENRKWLQKNYPKIKSVGSYSELLKNPEINAIVIATPIKTHYELTKRALIAGKDVFVEKPMTDKVKHAKELVRLAAKKKLVLFVGHIFSYHPVLAKIRSIAQKENLKYIGFTWNKFGAFDEGLSLNLASHDIATAINLFGVPSKVEILENRGILTSSDIIFVRLRFKGGKVCTIYINRLSNLKNKTVSLITDKSMYYWEDYQLLKLDKKTNQFVLIYKSKKTPLEIECSEFVKCLEQRGKPLTDGRFGLKVVKVLLRI